MFSERLRNAALAALVGVCLNLAATTLFSTNSALAQTNPYTRFGATSEATLPVSQIVGATSAEVGVGSGGSANYTVPIAVPPGTTGVQPHLTLQFTSPGGDGALGYGGSIGGLSYITRCPQNLYIDGVVDPVDYDANDRFCLNGERLIAVNGTYGAAGTEYRTRSEEFSKIFSYGSVGGGPAWFQVWRKSGEILYYGNTGDSRIEAVGSTAVRIWALNKLMDRRGNYVTYEYLEQASAGEFVIQYVDYTANDAQGLTANSHVIFQWEVRPQSKTFYEAGAKYWQQRRLKGVQVKEGTGVFRQYNIRYSNPTTSYPNGQGGQVASITECSDAASTKCFAPTQLSWVTADEGDGTYPLTDMIAPINNGGSTPGGIGGSTNSTTSHEGWGVVAVGDVNGDGRDDTIMMKLNGSNAKSGTGNDQIFLGNETGVFTNANIGASSAGTQIQQTGDFNGDGNLDLVIITGSGTHEIWFGKETAPYFTKVATTSISSNFSSGCQTYNGTTCIETYSYTIRQWIAGDYNSDARTDIYIAAFKVCAKNGTYGVTYTVCGSKEFVAFSNGDGTFNNVAATAGITSVSGVCFPACSYNSKNYVAVSVSDFNGDGRADIYLIYDPTEGYSNTLNNGVSNVPVRKTDGTYPDKVALSNGDGTFTTVTMNGAAGTSTASIPVNYRIAATADFNGDGNGDFYIHNSDSSGRFTSSPDDRLMLSKGDGTFQTTSLTDSAADSTHVGWTVGAVGDFDNDGILDIYAYRSDTSGLKTTTPNPAHDLIWRGQPDYSFTTRYPASASSRVPAGYRIAAVGDFNGDDAIDIYTYLADTTQPNLADGNPNDWMLRGKRIRYNLIAQVSNGLGNTTKFTYKPMTDPAVYTPLTGATYPVVDVISSSEVVYKVEASDGIGGFNAQTYKYEGLRESTRGAGALGFSKMTVTDEETGIVSESTYSHDYVNARQGSLLTAKTIAPNGTVLENKTVTWSVMKFGAAGPNQRFFPYISQTVTSKTDLNGSYLGGATTETATYDSYGFPTQIVTSTAYGSTVFTKTTANTYTHDTTNWILGRLTNATVTHSETGKPDIVRTSAFTYYPYGSLSSETVEPASPLAYTRNYVYNAFGAPGHVTENWGAGGSAGLPSTQRTTSYTYDAASRFKLTETNPKGHSASTAYHAVNGLVTSTTGPNGLTTSFTYDAFGNGLTETRADGTQTKTWRYNCGGSIVCPANAAFVVVSKSTGAPFIAAYKDRLARTVQETTVGLDGRLIDVKLTYNSRGDVTQKSEPTYEGDTIRWTNITFDILGRPIQTTNPDQSVDTISYNGLVVVSTNGLNQTKTITKNAIGQVISAKDTDNNPITYTYDAAGQQTAINSAGLVTETDYDMRGNKIAVRDTARGNSSYAYNALGLLVQSTDAKGQVTQMSYDILGRMLARTDDATAANPSQRLSSWVYDTASYGVGKLASSSGYGYSAATDYDSTGRPASITETIDGANFTVSTSYDSSGRPASTTYPSGLTVANVYGTYGHLKKVQDAAAGGATYWEATAVDARGNVTETHLGAKITEYRTFNNTTGRLSWITTYRTEASGQQTNIQNNNYSFDVIGNLTMRREIRSGQEFNETFTYDALNRVTKVSSLLPGQSTASDVDIAYNTRGDILSRSDVGTYYYTGTSGCGAGSFFDGRYAVKAITPTVGGAPVTNGKNTRYCYDLNGDMVSGDGRTISWSAFGMPTHIEKGTNSIDLAYGPDRARFKRIDVNQTGTTTTYYVAGGAFEVSVAQSGLKTQRAYIAGSAVVMRSETAPATWGAPETRYFLKDHLGSMVAEADDQGVIQQSYSFDAWGKRRQVDWTSYTPSNPFNWQLSQITRGYTFHEQLDPVGLVHMNGRVYDADIGRFLSADPFVQDITNHQAFNAYAYVQNNPLSYTDPSGFFLKGLFKAIGNFLRSVGRAFVHAARAIARSTIGRAILQIVACATPGVNAFACAAVGAGLTLAAGGTLKQAFIGAAISFVQMGAYAGVHQVIGGIANSTVAAAAKVGLHAVVGGAVSVAQGGSFETGALTGAVAAGSSLLMDSSGVMGHSGDGNPEYIAERTAVSAIAGGTASVLSGGKFANGAFTGAFAQLYNGEDLFGRYVNSCTNNVRCTSLQRAQARAEGRGAGSAESMEAIAEETAAGSAMAARGSASVYRSVNAAGDVQYVGITNNLARRAAEHLRGSGIEIEKVMSGLSRPDARAVEQALIEINGLGRNGGTLLNRINSISPSNPAYADQLRRGYDLLQRGGY